MTTQTFNAFATPVSHAFKFSLISLFLHADAAFRQRTALRGLDTAALDDIGLTRRQALGKAPLTTWDAPANWRI